MAKINSSPEKFLAQGQLGKDLVKSSQRHLADGALQLVQINGRPVKPLKLGNNEARVAAVLERTAVVGGGILNDNPVFIEHDIASSIIAPEYVPESYFELQEKIARERGYGNVDITPELKDEAIRTLRADQEESLTSWSNYLRDESNRNTYQDWFKVYAWESVKKLGDFDKQKMAFRRRQASTTGVYPELDAEALAYVYDKIDSHLLNGVISDDERISQLLQSGNFGKLYAHAVQEAGIVVSPDLRETIRGSWKKV